MKRFLIVAAAALALTASAGRASAAGGWSFAIGGDLAIGLSYSCYPHGHCGGTGRLGLDLKGNLYGHAHWNLCHCGYGHGHGYGGYGYGGYGYGGYGYCADGNCYSGYSTEEPPADKKPTLPAPTPGDEETRAGGSATQQVGYYHYPAAGYNHFNYPYQVPSYWYGN